VILPTLALLVAAAQPADEPEQVQAEFIAQHGDLPVTAVHVEGLHRTHPVVVNQWIDITPGAPLSRVDLRTIYERLNRLAIFASVKISIAPEGGGAAVTIAFDEKWTLYPVPIFWYFEGTEVAGLVLAEANAFGLNKGLALGGIYSNRGWYALAAYNDPNIAFTPLFGGIHAFVGRGLVENDAPDGSIEQSFDISRVDVEYGLGWTLWDRLSPGVTGAFRWAHVDAVHTPGAEPAVDAAAIVQGLQLIYSDRRYRLLFDEGVRVQAEWQHGFPIEAATGAYDALILDAKLALPLGPGSVELDSHVFLASMPVVFEERLGGIDGSRTLPGGGVVAADRYASVTLGYQHPILATGFGTLTGVVFGELGRYERNAEGPVGYGGPGAGLRFYLQRVSIPAIGVDAGYEVGSGRVAFSVVVGYRPSR
jgi:hypothetical protein